MNVELKNPQNAGNIKNNVDDLPRDMAKLNFPCDETANQIGHGNKKTKVK